MTIGEKFNEGYDQESCYACHYIEQDDGSVSGNTNCPDAPNDDMKMKCPAWATNGCYTGSAVHNMVSYIASLYVTTYATLSNFYEDSFIFNWR